MLAFAIGFTLIAYGANWLHSDGRVFALSSDILSVAIAILSVAIATLSVAIAILVVGTR